MVNEHEPVTRKIVEAKRSKGVKWSDIARAVGQSKEWTTSALLGQISLNAAQVALVTGDLNLDLTDNEKQILMSIPYRGSLPTAVPSDPLLYRLYEIVLVHGGAMKELIEEEFGDGIMSAIDFDMEITREPDPKGDRVRVNMTGKFLPYKTF